MRLTIVMLVACSSSYIPQSRGHVAVVLADGQVQYMRDGQRYPHGFFGAGLEDAVVGNRRAEDSAREFHDRVRTGALAAIAGAVCVPAVLGYALVKSASDPSLGRQGAEVAAFVALGCTALLIGGAAYAASAEPYRWDAINQFNDAATFAPQLGVPAPKQSLGMR